VWGLLKPRRSSFSTVSLVFATLAYWRESLALEMTFFPSVNYLTPPDWSTELFYWRRDRLALAAMQKEEMT
jgi:hypothetical protein